MKGMLCARMRIAPLPARTWRTSRRRCPRDARCALPFGTCSAAYSPARRLAVATRGSPAVDSDSRRRERRRPDAKRATSDEVALSHRWKTATFSACEQRSWAGSHLPERRCPKRSRPPFEPWWTGPAQRCGYFALLDHLLGSSGRRIAPSGFPVHVRLASGVPSGENPQDRRIPTLCAPVRCARRWPLRCEIAAVRPRTPPRAPVPRPRRTPRST